MEPGDLQIVASSDVEGRELRDAKREILEIDGLREREPEMEGLRSLGRPIVRVLVLLRRELEVLHVAREESRERDLVVGDEKHVVIAALPAFEKLLEERAIGLQRVELEHVPIFELGQGELQKVETLLCGKDRDVVVADVPRQVFDEVKTAPEFVVIPQAGSREKVEGKEQDSHDAASHRREPAGALAKARQQKGDGGEESRKNYGNEAAHREVVVVPHANFVEEEEGERERDEKKERL